MNRIAIVLNVFIASMVFAVGNDGGLENVQKQENGSGTESQTVVPVDVDRVQEIRQTRQAMDKDFRKQRILERKQEFDNNKTPDNDQQAKADSPRRLGRSRSPIEKHLASQKKQAVVKKQESRFAPVKEKLDRRQQRRKFNRIKNMPTIKQQMEGTFKLSQQPTGLPPYNRPDEPLFISSGKEIELPNNKGKRPEFVLNPNVDPSNYSRSRDEFGYSVTDDVNFEWLSNEDADTLFPVGDQDTVTIDNGGFENNTDAGNGWQY